MNEIVLKFRSERIMSKKIDTNELLKLLISEYKPVDMSVCGKCSKCGECCSNFLPITQEEAEVIQDYVIKNKIRPNKSMLVMQNRLSCPYYDGKECMIYEVRPLICKEFYCYKMPSVQTGEKLASEDRIPVNMWGIAEEIDKYFKRRNK